MTTLLKDLYNHAFLEKLSNALQSIDSQFDNSLFFKQTFHNNWEEKSLKERMRAIAVALFPTISKAKYRDKIAILKETAQTVEKSKHSGLTLIIFADFVEIYGLDDVDFSLSALAYFTEFGSAEFAIRQFIKRDPERVMEKMLEWSLDDNYHIRRLASEGCRPLLPWGEALVGFKKDPMPILPILENLKKDASQYVRRSVANNLNDISKNQPSIVLALMEKWQQENIDPKLIKHALRTLLKQGDDRALKMIGIDRHQAGINFSIQGFNLKKDQVKISQDLFFDFILENKVQRAKTRLEYAIYFLKKNGIHNKKIFQIATKELDKGVFSFAKKHAFKEMTTRKHYVGTHYISLIVNGLEVDKLEFNLI